jgi:hypothetical protein
MVLFLLLSLKSYSSKMEIAALIALEGKMPITD